MLSTDVLKKRTLNLATKIILKKCSLNGSMLQRWASFEPMDNRIQIPKSSFKKKKTFCKVQTVSTTLYPVNENNIWKKETLNCTYQ